MALRAEVSPSYDFDALATLKARNVDVIAFWCVRDVQRCANWETMTVDDAMLIRLEPTPTKVGYGENTVAQIHR